jgi:hypothetical protein
VAFRDRLKTQAGDRAPYARTKRELASRRHGRMKLLAMVPSPRASPATDAAFNEGRRQFQSVPRRSEDAFSPASLAAEGVR